MREFRSGKAPVMVATDVASRGLHIRGLPFVVNYDFPSRLEPYVHRVGCARVSAMTCVWCCCAPSDVMHEAAHYILMRWHV